MQFITNFDSRLTNVYLEAIRLSGEQTLMISPIARIAINNSILPGYGSLWLTGPDRDLSEFWSVFELVMESPGQRPA